MSGTTPVDARTDELVPLPEAAALLGVTPDAVRARIRRGLLRGRKGNRTWLVELPAGFRSLTQEQPDNDRKYPVAPDGNDGLAAVRLALTRLEERLRVDEELREALARSEGERDVARAEAALLRAALTKSEARADRLEAALVEARRGWLERLVRAWRREES